MDSSRFDANPLSRHSFEVHLFAWIPYTLRSLFSEHPFCTDPGDQWCP